jgi:AP-3 complex subunit beta
MIGSSSLVVGAESGISRLKGYEDLPEWVEAGQQPDPRLRDEERKAEYGEKRDVPAGEMLDNALKQQQQQKQGIGGKANGLGVGSGKEKTLDDWLAEEEESEETDEEGSTEEETSEEESDAESEHGDEKQRLVA